MSILIACRRKKPEGHGFLWTWGVMLENPTLLGELSSFKHTFYPYFWLSLAGFLDARCWIWKSNIAHSTAFTVYPQWIPGKSWHSSVCAGGPVPVKATWGWQKHWRSKGQFCYRTIHWLATLYWCKQVNYKCCSISSIDASFNNLSCSLLLTHKGSQKHPNAPSTPWHSPDTSWRQ